ncbi:MAG: hypothetical protein H0V54_03670 [Chthoniobacterales bacterium]|nr:hypothetical protein [Chthoniobacterales bacterium]
MTICFQAGVPLGASSVIKSGITPVWCESVIGIIKGTSAFSPEWAKRDSPREQRPPWHDGFCAPRVAKALVSTLENVAGTHKRRISFSFTQNSVA